MISLSTISLLFSIVHNYPYTFFLSKTRDNHPYIVSTFCNTFNGSQIQKYQRKDNLIVKQVTFTDIKHRFYVIKIEIVYKVSLLFEIINFGVYMNRYQNQSISFYIGNFQFLKSHILVSNVYWYK